MREEGPLSASLDLETYSGPWGEVTVNFPEDSQAEGLGSEWVNKLKHLK